MQDILKGLRVVEGSAFVAAPSGGMTLAQLGADVIRFDPIQGGIDYKRWPVNNEGKSLYWHSLNKGKRSIAVDFRKPEGQEILTRLIAQPGDEAGIFLTNFPAKGWLSDASLRQHREDLIFLNLTGDRRGGSALDYTVNCRVGLPMLNGFGEELENEPQYSKTLSAELPNPTDDTRDLLEVAEMLFRRIYRAGYRYAKSGVMLADFYEHGVFQQDLFRAESTKNNSKALMNVLDNINSSGLGNIFFASQGISQKWLMKREHLSPAYTTRWDELPKVF